MKALVLAAFAALSATAASALPVTFDLTSPSYTIVAQNATVTSDKGTTAQIRGYASSGNLLESTRSDPFGSAPGGVFVPTFGANVAFFGCGDRGCQTLELLFPTKVRLLSVTVNNLIGFSSGDPATPAPRTVNAFFNIGTYNSGAMTVAADGLPPISPTTFDFSSVFGAEGTLLSIGTAPGGISIRSITVEDPLAVPLPASAWLLFGSVGGIGALRAMVRRRRAA